MDSLQNPMFAPEEVERERAVIVEEIKRHEDNPWSKIYDEFTSAVFSANEYRRQVLGTAESLQTITRDTFVEYQQSRYQPQNTTFSIVGDVGLQEVEDALNQLLKNGSPQLSSPNHETFPIIEEPAEAVLHRDVNQAYLLLGIPTPRLLGTKVNTPSTCYPSSWATDAPPDCTAACRMSRESFLHQAAITGAWFMPVCSWWKRLPSRNWWSRWNGKP